MSNNLTLELYTRPTCSDCQAAKEYLNEQEIDYVHKNVGEEDRYEKELKEIVGSRIVPSFVFYEKSLFGKKKLVKNLIGFENNKEEIQQLLGLK
ncbi:glutaredoxin family protein [Rossellomorea sp. YZS02]|uniref:glutaredoxin family protein n=1 Tax=Rossellomorea sp. YZS02 TaxID=3097358 RepID=UPI002A0DC6B0|nr:glutaredoxin family protein [Rossellomorea sp. YZS02]MDX8344299.1 glutaredoxin family protein [Rossellomorea sp. YZS02]